MPCYSTTLLALDALMYIFLHAPECLAHRLYAYNIRNIRYVYKMHLFSKNDMIRSYALASLALTCWDPLVCAFFNWLNTPTAAHDWHCACRYDWDWYASAHGFASGWDAHNYHYHYAHGGYAGQTHHGALHHMHASTAGMRTHPVGASIIYDAHKGVSGPSSAAMMVSLFFMPHTFSYTIYQDVMQHMYAHACVCVCVCARLCACMHLRECALACVFQYLIKLSKTVTLFLNTEYVITEARKDPWWRSRPDT